MSGRISRSKAAALRSPSPHLHQSSDLDGRAPAIGRASQDHDVEQGPVSDDLEEVDDVDSPLALDSDEQSALVTPSQPRGAGRRRRGARNRGPARRKDVAEQDSQDNGSDTPRKRGGWRGRGFGAGRWAKARGGPSHAMQAPIDREGNLANVVNDEADLPEDVEGEQKVSKLGELYGGREYRVRTFKIEGKGDRLYMLSTEPARCIGFRDSYLFFQKHKQLYKIIIAEDAKKDLIDRDIIPHSYKGRMIGVVTARSVFREFGAKIIVGGKKILDDYLVSEARARGDIEGEYAVPEDELPGGAGHYDRNRYVAWHGASSVYHTANPSVPLLNGKSADSKKKRIVVTGANWMSEHALQASRFNSQIWIQRRQNLEGVYNVHTNSMQYPKDMQPTRVRWERMGAEPTSPSYQPLRAGDDPSLDWTISTAKPARYTHRLMVVDTHLENLSTSELDWGGPNVTNVGDDVIEQLPESCQQQLFKTRMQQCTWSKTWIPQWPHSNSIKESRSTSFPMVSKVRNQGLPFYEDRDLAAKKMMERPCAPSDFATTHFQRCAYALPYSTAAAQSNKYVEYPTNSCRHLVPAPLHQAPFSMPPIRSSNVPALSSIARSSPRQIGYTDQVSGRPSRSTFSGRKEKKGGVAAHLDYDIDDMVDFVSQMAYRMHNIFSSNLCVADIDLSRSIFHPQTIKIADDFRAFVSQILSSTRLPSSTILLGLLYISKRISILSHRGVSLYDKVDIYSMLIVGLTLGSKFLDDNTFQNRSWSEVSHIRVGDLNRLEYQWLADIKWDLHINHEDPDGLNLWIQQWHCFQNNKSNLSQTIVDEKAQLEARLSLGAYGCRGLPPTCTANLAYSPSCGEGDFEAGDFGDARHKGHAVSGLQRRGCFSPHSAPDSGPNTPENPITTYYNNHQNIDRPPAWKIPPPCRILPANLTPLERVAPSLVHSGARAPMDDFSIGQWPFCVSLEPPFMACA